MAGSIRQEIDIPSLEKYTSQHLPALKLPLELKQVSLLIQNKLK